MIKFLKNVSGDVLRLPAIRKKFPVDEVWQIPYSEMDIVMKSLDTLTAIRNGDLQVGKSDTEFFTDAAEGEAYLLDTFLGVNTVVATDDAITEIVPGVTTDPETGKKVSDLYFQILRMLRELYNEAGNPLYKDGFETISSKLAAMAGIPADVAQNTADIATNAGNISTLSGTVDSMQTDVTQNTTDIGTNAGNITTLQTDVAQNTTDIGTNAGNITTVQGDVSTLQTSVTQNTTDIGTNSGDITTLQGNVSTLQTDVSQNTTDIGTNSGNITTLQGDVSTNTTNIGTNTGAISALQTDVTQNTTDITTNAGNITTNTGNISTNAGAISTLQTDVTQNTTDIGTNAGNITTLQGDVTTAQGDITTLQGDVTQNTTDIGTNTAAISTNAANISTNAGDITTLQGSVSTNTANIATNASDISDLQDDVVEIAGTKPHLERPHDMLIYYGWLNSYNSDVNGWNNEKVAQDMARYNIIVIGDGIQDSGHGDYANTQIIIPRIKALNPNALIFGYVTIFQDLTSFQTKAGQWDTLEVDGIFLDEAGYDYGTTTTNDRAAFNTKVDYVHGLNYAKLCFANAWNMDHVIGTENDASYPNTTWNPSTVESNLNENDWFLLESFAVNTVSYTSDYEAHTDWAIRGNKAVAHRDFYDINIASVAVIENTHTDAANLFNFAFIAGLMYSLDAVGTSDASYGAGSAKVVMWSRPDISGMGRVWEKKPNVTADLTDADAYIRFTDFGKMTVDFTSGSEASEIVKN